MTKHTPGPWKFIGDALYGGEYIDSKGVEHHTDQVYPFFDEDRSQGMHGQRHEADKRLIAAAPDLLAACERAMEALSSRRFDTAAYDPHVTACERAIAKAKGGGA